MKKILKNIYVRFALFLLLGFLIGWFIKPSHNDTQPGKENISKKETSEQIWTCSMHPQIRRNEPGNCPICGMELIPLSSDVDAQENPMSVTMSPLAMQLAGVQTLVVSKGQALKEVRMSGKVQPDERLIFSQASHVPGRIEQLMINYTGEEVRKGQSLALVYSPELITAQEELFEAYKIKDMQPALFIAAREKLKNWKLTDAQIDKILALGKPREKFDVLADVSGLVLKKRVSTGDYIMKGMTVYDIADLSSVWILFDVYESDIAWVKPGSEVQFTVQSIPGESFHGKITFIDPVINPVTRVAKARVEFANKDLKLKPEMFVTGIVKSELKTHTDGLVIPKTAVMWTGTRSVVYVKTSDTGNLSFIMREVTLGPALGESFVVKDGLGEGEEIAVNGAFSIDAAAQLAGKPSMMNPQGGPAMTGHNHGSLQGGNTVNETAAKENVPDAGREIKIDDKAKVMLLSLFNDYLDLKDALVDDKHSKAKSIATSLKQKIENFNMSLFNGPAHNSWMKNSKESLLALQTIQSSSDIGEARQGFKRLSDSFIIIAVDFGPFDKELFVQHCPMANKNKGADWISAERKIQNPYFGQSMIGCGEVTRNFKLIIK